MKAMRSDMASNGVPSLQIRLVGSHNLLRRKKEGKREWTRRKKERTDDECRTYHMSLVNWLEDRLLLSMELGVRSAVA